jgi:hypothetical protein
VRPNLRQMAFALFAVLVLLLVGVLGYLWFNAVISLDYARQEQQYQRERVLLLRSLLEHTVTRMNRADLVRLVRQDFAKGHLVKESHDRIEVDDIVFKLQDDVVTDITFLGEENASDQREESRRPTR